MAIASRSQFESQSHLLASAVRKEASALSAASDLFLSHSSRDGRSLIDGAIQILTQHGASVYADVLDPAAKALTPGDFGAFFAKAIQDTDRLIALVTSQTASSRWVPWELGLGHGTHSLKRVAAWPVREEAEGSGWARQEYFELYPRIEWVLLGDQDQWGVRDPSDGRYWTLDSWLKLS